PSGQAPGRRKADRVRRRQLTIRGGASVGEGGSGTRPSVDSGSRPERAKIWRAELPRSGPGPYAMVDGCVLTDGLEVIVVAHCNLRCRGCAYLSPVMPVSVVPPEQIDQDLSVLARHYHASEARVLGGESLLHPDLVRVLQAIRGAGVCDTVRVITNGLLLPRMAAG